MKLSREDTTAERSQTDTVAPFHRKLELCDLLEGCLVSCMNPAACA